MSASNFIALLGGVALFLFGMGLMGDGLKLVAGNKLELVLYKLSSTPVKGVLLGTAVTAVIQSSSATSVMVVGFVNSAMMKLGQAISVIMGSILGTSITGWIIALSEIAPSGSGFISLISTSTLTGLIAITGIIIRMTSKKNTTKNISLILLGFAVLMYGISSMSGAVSPLKQSEEFVSLMTKFSNPFLGLLVGIGVTAILQSASSAVGLLQTLAITGAIDFSIAFPILLGMNIGASVPVLLSSIGAKVEAKRSAFSYLIISALGSFAVGILFYAINYFRTFSFIGNTVDAVSIAAINSIFRFISLIILFPQIDFIEKFLVKVFPETEIEPDSKIMPLEERFLINPAIALKQCEDAVHAMARVTVKAINSSINLLFEFSQEEYNKVSSREDIVDKYEDKLSAYLIKITSKDLTDEQSSQVSEYLHVIGDLERISDHAVNIADCALEKHEKKLNFSTAGNNEIITMLQAIQEVLATSIKSFKDNDNDLALRVEPLEELIDTLCDKMKLNHIRRLSAGKCTLELGYVFNDLLSNFERISDHASNIALAVIEHSKGTYDPHAYVESLQEKESKLFKQYYEEYKNKFKV